MSRYDDILQKPAFSRFDQAQKEAFRQTLARLEGKSPMEAFPIVMDFAKQMGKGKSFSKAEQDAMLETLYENLSQGDKETYNKIMRLLQTMK